MLGTQQRRLTAGRRSGVVFFSLCFQLALTLVASQVAAIPSELPTVLRNILAVLPHCIAIAANLSAVILQFLDIAGNFSRRSPLMKISSELAFVFPEIGSISIQLFPIALGLLAFTANGLAVLPDLLPLKPAGPLPCRCRRAGNEQRSRSDSQHSRSAPIHKNTPIFYCGGFAPPRDDFATLMPSKNVQSPVTCASGTA
jgi:hypothetical protein